MATFLINALWRRLELSSKRTNAGDVVNQVVTQYIQGNSLAVLRADQRPLVARAVFKALDESSRNKGTAWFPEPPSAFTGEKKLDSCFFCLLDINVESKGGNKVFVDSSNPFSVSISRAICILLLSLIDTVGSTGSSWSSFQNLCALSELQRVVMATEDQDLAFNLPQLVMLKKPFPEVKAQKTIAIPMVGGAHVFLNGDKAPFADVIAPHRLCQCKFSEDATNSVTLELGEFVKMGIVKKICDPDENGQPAKMRVKESNQVKQKMAKLTRQFYPGCLLVGETDFGPQPGYEMFNFTVNKGDERNLLSKVDDKDGKCEYNYTDNLEQEIEAVFYTNACQFEIKRGGRTAVVTPDDVTFDGIITSDINISEVLRVEMRENVSLRFLFARDYKGL
ncbi:MAG: hypothetical protein SGBAC_006388 [Bacillariaceae sp.]